MWVVATFCSDYVTSCPWPDVIQYVPSASMFTCSLKSIVAYMLFGIGVQQYDNEKRRILYLLEINKFDIKNYIRLKNIHFIIDRILDNEKYHISCCILIECLKVRLELLALRPPFFSFFFSSYCATLKHEFAVELVIFTNQNLSKSMNRQHLWSKFSRPATN